jgi:hypothetical protein
MGGAIGPGDWLEIVSACSASRFAGTVVQCIEVVPLRGRVAHCMVCGRSWDFGIKATNLEPMPHGYSPCYFRPIYRPKSELLESLLRKANEPIREDA